MAYSRPQLLAVKRSSHHLFGGAKPDRQIGRQQGQKRCITSLKLIEKTAPD
jgi:hypothetical protein